MPTKFRFLKSMMVRLSSAYFLSAIAFAILFLPRAWEMIALRNFLIFSIGFILVYGVISVVVGCLLVRADIKNGHEAKYLEDSSRYEIADIIGGIVGLGIFAFGLLPWVYDALSTEMQRANVDWSKPRKGEVQLELESNKGQ